MIKNGKELLYKQIKQLIVKEILELGPGGRLPSRPSLVKKYGVSRTTIDQAVSELIGENILYSMDGSGTYVCDDADKWKINQKHSQNVRSIGVIMPNISSQIFPEMLRGIEDMSHEYNINIVICNSYLDPRKQNDYIRKLIQSNISGLIIFPAIDPNDQLIGYSLLREHDIPFVFCGRSFDNITAPKIIMDNYEAGKLATKYLIDNGCRKIAFVFSILYQTVEERIFGYMSALRESGMEIDYSLIAGVPDEDHLYGGYVAMNALLERQPNVDGVVSFSDEIAYGVMNAAREKNFKIPANLRVIGNGDYEISNRFDFKLSTILYPKYELGQTAVSLLMKLIEKSEPIANYHRIVLSPELIIRET
jgi:LacI family transcriptional regulator